MGRQCVELGGCMSQQFYTMKELPVSERPYEKAKEQEEKRKVEMNNEEI